MALSNDRPNPSLRGTATSLQGRGGEWGDGGRNGRRGVRSYAPTLTVTLTLDEIRIASVIGVLRNLNSVQLSPRAGATDWRLGWEENIIGACAEMAFAKFLNRSYLLPELCGDFSGIEVRATLRKDGSLIVRQNDSSAKRYVLVICEMPKFHIVGWIWGSDAKDPKYWQAPNGRPGAYFVPQSALKPLP